MALKPTWQVKDDGGMGLGAHMSLEKNGHPRHIETELGRAGPWLEDSKASSRDHRGWGAGKNERRHS